MKGIEDIINKRGIKYAKPADIFDRIKINSTSNCFITLKNHKENFVNHPTTRLKTKSEELANRYWIKSILAYARN